MSVAGAWLPLLALAAGCAAGAGGVSAPGEQAERTLNRRIVRELSGRYLLYLPPQYDPRQRWPLLLFLHGAGERGDDLARVRMHGPPRLVEQRPEEFPFLVLSPQVPEERIWSVQLLDALLEEIEERYAVDPDRIYVTGLSMGGYGAWHLAMEFPHRFAAIAPISGGGTITGACTLRHLPIWVFHGAQDEVVPPSRSEELVARLRGCEGNVRFTLYPDAGHDAWTRTYENPELYAWLLRHRRNTLTPRPPLPQAGEGENYQLPPVGEGGATEPTGGRVSDGTCVPRAEDTLTPRPPLPLAGEGENCM